jgi:seryl-tRNA synthetase
VATSEQIPPRFRSATEFPKTIGQLNRSELEVIYGEMRECLIFTNRSRAQLLRRNEEHKQSAIKLKTDVERLQVLINQLNQEKQKLAQSQQLVIANLEQEISSMSKHLDNLSEVYNTVADIEDMTQTQWSFLSLPQRFFQLLRAVKSIVLTWRKEHYEDITNTSLKDSSHLKMLDSTDLDKAYREQPQMYDDPASIGRSLLAK